MDIDNIVQETLGYAVIYMLTSPSNKSYIGQTISFKERYSTYKRQKNNSIGKKLGNAFTKYGGIDNFKIQILAKLELSDNILELKEQLSALEIFYIQEYDTFNTGYNSTIGGEGSLGRIMSEATKKKISATKLGCGKVQKIKIVCGTCKAKFEIRPCEYKARLNQKIHDELYCSVKCSLVALSKRKLG